MGQEAILFLLQPSFFCIFPLLFLITFFSNGCPQLQPPTETYHHLPPSSQLSETFTNSGYTPTGSLQSFAQQHGPLMLLRFGSVPVLVASSTDAGHEIMKTHDRIFSNRPKSSIPSRLLYDFKGIAFAPYGEYWRQVKSIAVLKLLSHKRVQSFRKVREQETNLLIGMIREALSSPSLINFCDMFMLLTNDVVCRVALGRKYSRGAVKRKILKEFGELLDVFNVRDCIPRLGWVNHINGLDAKVERVAKESDEYLETILQEHMDQEKGVISCYGESVEGKEMDLVDILRDNMTGIS